MHPISHDPSVNSTKSSSFTKRISMAIAIFVKDEAKTITQDPHTTFVWGKLFEIDPYFSLNCANFY